MTYSVRPRSDAVRTGSTASTTSARAGGSPAMARSTGATNSWNVKMAEVGKPGSTATGTPSCTARHNGLPGLSATPCTMMPGLRSRPAAVAARSPAPLDVPPDSSTMSASASARSIAAARAPGSASPRNRLSSSTRKACRRANSTRPVVSVQAQNIPATPPASSWTGV